MILKNVRKTVFDFVWYIIGAFIYSSAVTMFITPNEISPGGFTGIATLLNYLFSVPSGIILLLLNIPVLIIGFLKFGGIFIIKTSIATIIVSFALTVTDVIFPPVYIDKILASLFGGILMGLGLSLILLRGATTGGVDILAKLINRRFRHLTVGRVIFIMDAVVVALAAIVYGNIQSALYSSVSLYATSTIMDKMLYGGDRGKLIYIVSPCYKEICKEITTTLSRGVTLVSAKGGYTGEDRPLILCSVRLHEVSAVYSILDKIDKKAFIIVADAGEIIGEGFKAFG